PLNFSSPVFAADGKILFVAGEQRRGQLMRYDKKSHQFVPYLSGVSAERVGVSPDSEWAAYISYPDYARWRSKVDGTHKQQLTFPPFAAHLPSWSPDGHRIIFDASTDGKTNKVYLISPEGGDPLEILPG